MYEIIDYAPIPCPLCEQPKGFVYLMHDLETGKDFIDHPPIPIAHDCREDERLRSEAAGPTGPAAWARAVRAARGVST